MSDIGWNLVSLSLLGKVGLTIMFKSNKIMLTKNDSFVGKGYCNQGYRVVSCDVWHGRLGYVNFSYIKKMVELSLIPKLSLENLGKCEVCVESKTIKKSCKPIERESKLLNLIHSDLGDLKNTMTSGGKRLLRIYKSVSSKKQR